MATLSAALWLGFAGGLCAFPHCLGMCGGFVLHLAQEQRGRDAAVAQLSWLVGKVWSYLLLGALAGYAGGRLTALFLGERWWQDLLAFAAGGAMLLAGVSLLGLLPVRRAVGGESLALLFCRPFLGTRSPGSAFLLGVLSACLPCPVVVALLASALRGGSVAGGMATMAALGAGTAVPLLFFGSAARIGAAPLRRWGTRAGGVILVLLGVTTALRGTAAYHRLLGCPAVPAATETVKPCCIGENHGARSN